MEALHLTMLNNGNTILGMYDEMSVLYSQLDAYKHSGSKLDRNTLLKLYTGGSWSRTFKNKDASSSKMAETSFNMCGFIQPSFVVTMLEEEDPEAFNDRQFFICPKEVDFKYEELKVPMDPSVPELSNVFRTIKRAHERKVTYIMSAEGKRKFIEVHDELRERKLEIKDDVDRRGILSKCKGQICRIAMILQCIEQAVNIAANGDREWSYLIEASHIKKAFVVLNYLIDQKFALMKPEFKDAL